MDELAAAVALAAISIDDGAAAEKDPLEAVEAQAAADVLRTQVKLSHPSQPPMSS